MECACDLVTTLSEEMGSWKAQFVKDLHEWHKEEVCLHEVTCLEQEWLCRAAQSGKQEAPRQDQPAVQHLVPTKQGRKKGQGQVEASPLAVSRRRAP